MPNEAAEVSGVTSRERVLKAVNFERPDRVPIDLGSTRASGISADLYDRLKKRLGIKTPTKVCDPMQIPLPGAKGWTNMEQVYLNP